MQKFYHNIGFRGKKPQIFFRKNLTKIAENSYPQILDKFPSKNKDLNSSETHGLGFM
jgi:hypothetical protein